MIHPEECIDCAFVSRNARSGWVIVSEDDFDRFANSTLKILTKNAKEWPNITGKSYASRCQAVGGTADKLKYIEGAGVNSPSPGDLHGGALLWRFLGEINGISRLENTPQSSCRMDTGRRRAAFAASRVTLWLLVRLVFGQGPGAYGLRITCGVAKGLPLGQLAVSGAWLAVIGGTGSRLETRPKAHILTVLTHACKRGIGPYFRKGACRANFS